MGEFSYKDKPPNCWEMCTEYLDLVDRYPCPLSYSRGHVFKMLHHLLQMPENFDVREIVAKAKSKQAFRDAVAIIKSRYINDPNTSIYEPRENTDFDTVCLSGRGMLTLFEYVCPLACPFSVWPRQGFYVGAFLIDAFSSEK